MLTTNISEGLKYNPAWAPLHCGPHCIYMYSITTIYINKDKNMKVCEHIKHVYIHSHCAQCSLIASLNTSTLGLDNQIRLYLLYILLAFILVC